MNAFVIDAFEYSRLRERREGEISVSDLARLSAELADGLVKTSAGSVHWSLQGGDDVSEHSTLTLSVSGMVQLICQRCLTAMPFEIASESVLVLAKDEARADEIDALLDDDSIDVIVGSKALNVIELIEDEALLTLPLSPKHKICPDQATLEALKNAKAVSPFSVLKGFKQ